MHQKPAGRGWFRYADRNSADVKALWAFGDRGGLTAADSSPNNNIGTLVGGTTWDFDNTLKFDGTTGKVTSPSVAGGPLDLRTQISIGVRFKLNGASGGTDHYFVGSDNGGGFYQWRITMPSPLTTLVFQANQAVIDATSAAFTALTIGTWYTVVVTYDGARVVFYIDGNFISASAKTGTMGTDVENISIGGQSTDNLFFNGNFDCIRVDSRAWSHGEVNDFTADPFRIITLPPEGYAAIQTSVAALGLPPPTGLMLGGFGTVNVSMNQPTYGVYYGDVRTPGMIGV